MQAMRVLGYGEAWVVTESEGSGAGCFQAFVFLAGSRPRATRAKEACCSDYSSSYSLGGVCVCVGERESTKTHACIDEASSCQNCYHWCFLSTSVKYDLYRKVYKTSLFSLMNDYKANTHLTITRSRQGSSAPQMPPPSCALSSISK